LGSSITSNISAGSQATRIVRVHGRFHVTELNGVFAPGGSPGN
jgi:hypothetical protein